MAVLFLVQPTDRLGAAEGWHGLEALLYDDYDGACMALRGLNALRGRTPGEVVHPPWLDVDAFNAALDAPAPLKEGYYLEYPHATLLLFQLGYLFAPDPADRDVPAAVLDNSHHCLVAHRPRNEDERALWRDFRLALRIYTVLMAICLILLMAVVARGYEPGGRLSGPAWLFVLPAALYFALMRFDVVPALLVAASLFCLGRRWRIASAVLLGAATMVKVYPLLLAPIVFRYLSSERRSALVWAATYTATVAAFLLSTAAFFGWPITFLPYRIQLGRELEPFLTLYSYALPPVLAGSSWFGRSFRLGSVFLTLLLMSRRRPTDLVDVLRRGCTVLVVFLAVQVFYSPQWLLWLLPLLASLARQRRSVLYLTIGLDLVTYLSFPVDARLLSPYGDALLVYARLAIWIALLWTLWRAEWTSRKPDTFVREEPSLSEVRPSRARSAAE